MPRRQDPYYSESMNKELQHKAVTSKIFTQFKKIPDKAFHDFYFFYQFYYPQITNLEYSEYIEIKFNYIKALFYLDKYKVFYKQSEELLSEILNDPDFDENSRIIYEDILSFRASAFQNENKLALAKNLYIELIKLNKNNKKYKRKLFFLLFQEKQVKNLKYIAVIIFFILMSLFCNFLSIVIIKPFFSDWAALLIVFRNTLFIFGATGFLLVQGSQFKTAIDGIRKAKLRHP